MAGLNKCEFIGRFGKKGEYKTFNGGGAVFEFSLAVPGDRTKNEATGKWEEETEWPEFKAFNAKEGRKLADILNQYTDKGDQIHITARQKTERWNDKNTGEKRSKIKYVVLDFVLLGNKKEGSETQTRQEPQSQQSGYSAPQTQAGGDEEEPIPF